MHLRPKLYRNNLKQYRKSSHENVETLPREFADVAAWIDGIRLNIRRPYKNQQPKKNFI